MESRTLAPVVQKVDNAIRWINLYPLDSVIGFPNIYPLDSAIHLLKKRGLSFGIWNTAQGIRNPTDDRNPTNDWNPESHY